MNKELMLIQFSKYLTIGTISVIASLIVALIGLWIYSEWLIYQQKQSKQLDKVRDKMDGIELKRLLKQQDSIGGGSTDKTISQSTHNLSDSTLLPTTSGSETRIVVDTNRIKLKLLDGLP